MGDIDKNVSSFLEEVGIDSEEHKKYLEKLKRVLEEMKGSTNSAERKQYVSFKETVDTFERYLAEKKINLTNREKERFAVITGSGLGNLAKKRMTEDLIHQVKDRIASELELQAEEGRRKEDIAALKTTGFWLADWYLLTKFALEFGTITLFTHQYRTESLDLIRLKASAAHKEIILELKNILDGYYYYLTILEYNSIVKLYRMKEALDKLASIRQSPSYNPMSILVPMNNFAAHYIAVMRNIKSIDRGFQKVFKDRQPGHGFTGYVGFLTNRHIFNSKTVRHSEKEMMVATITGALYSYYTAYLGVRVKTFNQLMYIAGEDGTLNSSEKEYTPEAKDIIESEKKEQNTEGSKIKFRLSELVNLTTRYRDMGISLSKRLFEIEARGSLQAWNKDAQTKAFFRIMKVFDAYLKYILELVINRGNFDLEYDNRIVTDYFENFPELIRAVDECRTFSIELQGSRGKDLLNFKYPPDADKDEFIKKIMEESSLNLSGETRQQRETLNEISTRCYSLCIWFNDLLNKFNRTGKYGSGEITENYDFLLNARIIHPKVRNLEHVLNKKELYLVDLLEAGCSVAEYFAETLKNSGISAIYAEVTKLQKELEDHNLKHGSSAETADDGNSSGEEGLRSDVNKIYTDSLTGFRKWEYFEDFIFPEYYNEEWNYTGDNIRNVFCAELSNLVDVNRICGNDSGDKVYKRLSEIINETLCQAGSNNIAMRSRGGLIIGYINDIPMMESVDLLHKILKQVKNYSSECEIDFLPELVFNAGIYPERRKTNAFKNIEIARKIMFQGSDGNEGRVIFLRNPDHVLSDKDFDSRGKLGPGVISILK